MLIALIPSFLFAGIGIVPSTQLGTVCEMQFPGIFKWYFLNVCS